MLSSFCFTPFFRHFSPWDPGRQVPAQAALGTLPPGSPGKVAPSLQGTGFCFHSFVFWFTSSPLWRPLSSTFFVVHRFCNLWASAPSSTCYADGAVSAHRFWKLPKRPFASASCSLMALPLHPTPNPSLCCATHLSRIDRARWRCSPSLASSNHKPNFLFLLLSAPNTKVVAVRHVHPRNVPSKAHHTFQAGAVAVWDDPEARAMAGAHTHCCRKSLAYFTSEMPMVLAPKYQC